MLSNQGIEEYLVGLENDIKHIKNDLFRISWFMRGGVSINDLMFVYSFDDVEILRAIIQENVKNTKESGMPLV